MLGNFTFINFVVILIIVLAVVAVIVWSIRSWITVLQKKSATPRRQTDKRDI